MTDNQIDDTEDSTDKHLDTIFNAKFHDLKTAMPGRVEKYYPDKQWADIQPLFKRVYLDPETGEEKISDYPVIHNVPINFPKWGGMVITFPIKSGDEVWLNFSERALNTFKSSDGKTIVDPKINRMHNINDAIAFPGVSTSKSKISNVSTDNLVIRSLSGEVEIHVTPSKEVQIKADKIRNGSLSANLPHAKGNETQDSLDSLKNWCLAAAAILTPLGLSAPPPVVGNVKSSKVFLDG